MAPKKRARTFTSALVPFVLALVRASGSDASKLEKKYLRVRTEDGLALPEVSLEELGALMTEAGKQLDDPLFGLHCALAMPRGSYGLLEFALRSAPTGLVAMEQLAKYGALINPLVRWSLDVDGDEVALHHRAPHKDGVGRQANTFTVARVLAISREMLGERLMPERAWFAHREPRCPPELAAHLGTKDISFGHSSNGISFKKRDLERKTEAADPALNQALQAHAKALLADDDSDEVYARARKAVVELLPRGDASLAKTAKRLHLTSRTLQRRLLEEGVAFGDLVAEVRKDRAEKLLARSDASVAEVAQSVGYADAGAFVRAYRKWTGTTPGKFRESRQR